MPSAITITAGAGAAALGVGIFLWRKKQNTEKRKAEENIAYSIKVINARKNPISNEEADPLLARSKANARLINAFGIKNIFTTEDKIYAAKFRTQSIEKLRNAINLTPNTGNSGNWVPLRDTIRYVVKNNSLINKDIINLAELVQFVTLKVSLEYLFNSRVATTLPGEQTPVPNEEESIIYVATTINILWTRSKSPSTSISWKDQGNMHSYLKNLTSLDPLDSNDNPMNWIIPAYETMWRAVYRGLLEVYFRQPPNRAQEYQQLLFDFIDHPDKEVFKGAHRAPELCSLDIIKEILRLYPPARRIYRVFNRGSEDRDSEDRDSEDYGSELLRADLEKLHQNVLLAPIEPRAFKPERWVDLRMRFDSQMKSKDGTNIKTHEERLGFLPFTFKCPAGQHTTEGFGYKMIALIIAAVMEGLEDLKKRGQWELETGEDGLPPLGVPLKSERDDYLNLLYRKVQ
jgi:hypothetical protein